MFIGLPSVRGQSAILQAGVCGVSVSQRVTRIDRLIDAFNS